MFNKYTSAADWLHYARPACLLGPECPRHGAHAAMKHPLRQRLKRYFCLFNKKAACISQWCELITSSCVLCCWCQRAYLSCFPTLVLAFMHHTSQMSACSPFLWMLCCQCFMTYSLILTHRGHQYLIEVEATFSHGLRMDMVCMHNTHSVQMHISALFLQSYLHMKLCWSRIWSHQTAQVTCIIWILEAYLYALLK